MSSRAIVLAKGLRKSYGGVEALKGISFAIRAGECFGFLGHNGAGKSTTMRMIYGLSQVEEGELTVLDRAVKGLTPAAVKGRLGIVPQEDNLDPDLTVLDNLIAYGGYFGLKAGEAKARGLALLDFMGIGEKRDAQVETLSGGNKRRLVIARALINKPELLILDEPTTGLDPQGRRLVWQKLRRLKDEGVTMILTTHYMEEAEQLCDRLVLMNDGEILAEGTPQDLVSKQVDPCVIEVRAPLESLPERIEEAVLSLGARPVYLAEGLFIFAKDGIKVWRELESIGLPQANCYMRAANLEDVFLQLTGRREEG